MPFATQTSPLLVVVQGLVLEKESEKGLEKVLEKGLGLELAMVPAMVPVPELVLLVWHRPKARGLLPASALKEQCL